MIKFGISKDYVPDWGVVQAIREIYQNFIDFGEFNVEIEPITDDQTVVTLSNDFKPESWEFLKIGFTKKKKNAIGGHGEGLKLAGLVFLRNNLTFKIYTNFGTAYPDYYTDENLGECYGIDIKDAKTDKFQVSFVAENKDIEVFKNSHIKEEDKKQSSYYGDIVNKPDGNIYVGGLFVCNLEKLKYSFNFKPQFVKLGRDRAVPSTWDMEYYMNQIINGVQSKIEFKASDINNREFNAGEIPHKLATKFKPEFTDTGNLILKSGKTIITDEEKIQKISNNPVVAKKIEKLRYSVVYKTKRTPSTVLIELKDNLNLDYNEKIKFDSVIKLSRSWKNK